MYKKGSKTIPVRLRRDRDGAGCPWVSTQNEKKTDKTQNVPWRYLARRWRNQRTHSILTNRLRIPAKDTEWMNEWQSKVATKATISSTTNEHSHWNTHIKSMSGKLEPNRRASRRNSCPEIRKEFPENLKEKKQTAHVPVRVPLNATLFCVLLCYQRKRKKEREIRGAADERHTTHAISRWADWRIFYANVSRIRGFLFLVHASKPKSVSASFLWSNLKGRGLGGGAINSRPTWGLMSIFDSVRVNFWSSWTKKNNPKHHYTHDIPTRLLLVPFLCVCDFFICLTRRGSLVGFLLCLGRCDYFFFLRFLRLFLSPAAGVAPSASEAKASETATTSSSLELLSPALVAPECSREA